MGVDSNDELKEMHQRTLSQAYHSMNTQFILMIRDACTSDARQKSRDSEALRRILFAPDIQLSIDTNVFTGVSLPIDPWDILPVRMWFEIIQRFEGIVDAININFVKEFGDLIKNSKSSIYEVKQQYNALVLPVSKNFTTLQGFLDYLGCAVEEESIRRKSLMKDAEGEAWKQADDLIASARSEGAILSDELIAKAVKLAEEYLKRITVVEDVSATGLQ